MPSDLITINTIVCELDNKLKNARIEKISEPESDEIMFTVRLDKASVLLVISANPNNPRIHLTTAKKFNPYAAPSFCMLLRKYLSNAVIDKIETVNNDRIVKISLTARNELYDLINLSIYVELMGRYSNIILVDQENKIIDAIRHIQPDESDRRIILPNIQYTFAPISRISLIDTDRIQSCLLNFKGGDLGKYAAENISGLSYVTANEIIIRARIFMSGSELNDEQINNIIEQLKIFKDIITYNQFEPSVLSIGGEIKDFFIMPYKTLQGEYRKFNSVNEAADYYFSIKDNKERLRLATGNLVNTINNHIKRTQKALAFAEEKLLECEKMDSYREFGDMVLANIYKIKKGMTEVTVDNFFNNSITTIPLDITLNPQQNANKYYKKYSKLARSKQIEEKQKEEHINQIGYLKSVLSELSLIDNPEDADEIKEELIEEKIIQDENPNKKIRKPVKSAPRSYSIDGFKIYCGKNNLDNEFVTFKIASASDIFLHVKQIHGSHVIIITDGKTVPDKVIEKAAGIAAYYSDARKMDKVAVDYTLRRNVKKHPSGKKGMVIYTDYSTANVEPCDNVKSI